MKQLPFVFLAVGLVVPGCGKQEPAATTTSSAASKSSSLPSLQASAEPAPPLAQATAAAPRPPAIDFATAARPVNEKGDPMSDLEMLNQALFNYNEARATGAAGASSQLRTYKTEAEQMAAEAAQQKSAGPVTDLSELVKAGIIKQVPTPPAGKRYAIDPKTHQAILVASP